MILNPQTLGWVYDNELRTPVNAKPSDVVALDSAKATSSTAVLGVFQSGTRIAHNNNGKNSIAPKTAETIQSPPRVRIETNRLCAVNITPKINSTNVPPT